MTDMEVKLPATTEIADIQRYFRVTDELALRLIGEGKWVRVKESIGMRMAADPKLNGMRVRDSAEVVDASWWMAA